MSVIPLTTDGEKPSVVFEGTNFTLDGNAVLIKNVDKAQFPPRDGLSNISYDLRVGEVYRDHRNHDGQTLGCEDSIKLYPGGAAIIQTEEWVEFPKSLFGQILPKVSLLALGIANIPSKVDPGYKGHLLITAFNQGQRVETLKRFQKFCSLHLVSVDIGVTPYDRPGKYIVGTPYRRRLQGLGDHIRTQSPIYTVVIGAIAIVVSIVALFKWW